MWIGLLRLRVGGRPVTVDALVDAVWPGKPPAGVGNALPTLVSRLRRLGMPVQTLPGGYAR